MNHIQISIAADDAQQEKLISFLSLLGATGFEQLDNRLLAYFMEDAFPSYDVNELVKEYSFEITTLQERNWNEEWEKGFEPVVVNDFCAIRAHFHQPIPGVAYDIQITPKMSFGTGHHATTHMMIEHMQAIDFIDQSVFDFGTGTGILAILAEKLGAAKIMAIDNDEWSYKNARENATINNCTKIEVQLSSNLPNEQFDVVLANINRNVILKYISYLKDIVKPGGLLLLSGLLVDNKPEIMEACTNHGFNWQSEKTRSNWLSMLFKAQS